MVGVACGIGLDASPTSTSAVPATIRPFVVAIWDQSGRHHILLQADDLLPPEPLVAQDRVTFYWHDRENNGAAGVVSVTLNDTTVAGNMVTSAMVATANAFMRQMPGRHIRILMHTQPGTDQREIMDDTFGLAQNPRRRWEDDWALNVVATADGHLVEFCWHCWFGAIRGVGAKYGRIMYALMTGRDSETGALLDYSGGPVDIEGVQVSRTLRDIYPHEPKWIAVPGPNVFYPDEDLSNAITRAAGGADTSLANTQACAESWRAVIRNPLHADTFTQEVFQLATVANGYDQGDGVTWFDPLHPYGGTDAGINRMGRLVAHQIMLGAGITNRPVPHFDIAEWPEDGDFVRIGSSAGPITTPRRKAVLESIDKLDMSQITAIHDAILDGRIVTGSRVTDYESASDWQVRTGIEPSRIDGDAGVIRGVDFTGVNVMVDDGGRAAFIDCLFHAAVDDHFDVDVFAAGIATFDHCTFQGHRNGSGPGTQLRRRPSDGVEAGHMVVRFCRFEGAKSDCLKPTQRDIVLFNYLDTPTTVAQAPTIYAPGAYAVGDHVIENDMLRSHIFINQLAGNTQSPDFAVRDVGNVSNGWEYINPHSDNLTLVAATDAVVAFNVLNLDPYRRQGDGPVSPLLSGGNANVWFNHGEDYSGALVAANLCLRHDYETGGNPIGALTNATIMLNRVESRGREGVFYFDSLPDGLTATYAGNVDAVSGAALVPPTNGTAGAVDRSLLNNVATDQAAAFATAQQRSAPVVPAHWTDDLALETDGQPVERAEIQEDGFVQIYPTAGAYTNTTVLNFGRGGASGWLRANEDGFGGLWDDYPIVDVGLPDIPGYPVTPMPDAGILASTIPGAPMFRTSDAGPMFQDSAVTGTGRKVVTLLFEGSIDPDQADTDVVLVGANGSTFTMNALKNSQQLRLRARADGGGTQTRTSGAGLFTLGVQFTAIARIDIEAGTIKAWVDDVLVLDVDDLIPGAQFQTGRRVQMLGNNTPGNAQVKGQIARLAIWYHATADGSEPAIAPYKAISGGPEAVNSDDWRRGDVAT